MSGSDGSWVGTDGRWDLVDLDDLPYDDESFDVVHVRFAKLRVRPACDHWRGWS